MSIVGVKSARSVAFAGMVVAGVGGCDPDLPGKPKPADRPKPFEHVLDFSAIYARSCAGCHGATGRFGPAPPVNDPLFRAIVPESELKAILTRGRAGTCMPPFLNANGGSLSSSQIQVVIDGIKGTAREQLAAAPGDKLIVSPWGAVPKPPDNVPSYLSNSKGAPEAGKALFLRACATCHGTNGEGVNGANQINQSAFLSLMSDQAIRRIIITGRPDLKMPNYSEKTNRPSDFQPLTNDDIDNIVAYVASWRK